MQQRTDGHHDDGHDGAPTSRTASSDPATSTVRHLRPGRDPERPLPPAEELLELLHDVLRAVRRDTADRLGPGAAPGQLRMLRVLDRCERPCRLGELAEALDVAPRSVTTKVDQAEADGWIRRIPDPRDRRATLVELTDAGHDLLDRAARQRHAGVRARLDALDPDEQRTLLDLLRRVAGATPGD
ncbi:transcriptional regulator, MarR family [Cellulomonas flavigena DSM 20109]|uniref:Transcriptional regulator, MarR family n=1 Tax=Cellulomonas flavigena (strain ATCC 482 / DSM 20109 / BCRC 11376 / JCM 18109 / NBRC 3775 / NCIMB 8073 / NRS 134) TaxID=446466 RepID=D5UGC4_CELFN|nr:MarR family transcriptional regulator [Cellulomonas flavigena]ADG73107.1 transcriptional regulator, MarR family [Cellulomonas flavigena DSM 20109]